MDHIETQEKVNLVEKSTGRKGTGDRATYNVAQRMVYLIGAPAKVTQPNGSDISGETIAMDLDHNKVNVISPKIPGQGTYKPQP